MADVTSDGIDTTAATAAGEVTKPAAGAAEAQAESTPKTYSEEEFSKALATEKKKMRSSIAKAVSDDFKKKYGVSPEDKETQNTGVPDDYEKLKAENAFLKNVGKVTDKGVSPQAARAIARDILADLEEGETFDEALAAYDLSVFAGKPAVEDKSKTADTLKTPPAAKTENQAYLDRKYGKNEYYNKT